MPVLFSFTTCSHWGWYHVFTQLYPCKHKRLHVVGCIHIQFFTWLKLLEMKMWGKILEEVIWRSSAIECNTGSWWNFSRIVLNSKPWQVTGIDIQTSYMLNKNEQTKTQNNNKTCFVVSEAFGHFTACNLYYWRGVLGFLNIKKSTGSSHCVYWICLKGAESLAAG